MIIEPGSKRHLVKRYSQTRLYDTTTQQYVNFTQVRAFASAGEDVTVVDAETQADITDSVLRLAS